MKPIIVFVENGKIIMTPEEFKKHMDDAYQKGYSDASSINGTWTNTPSPRNPAGWWEKITYSGSATNTTNNSINE